MEAKPSSLNDLQNCFLVLSNVLYELCELYSVSAVLCRSLQRFAVQMFESAFGLWACKIVAAFLYFLRTKFRKKSLC